jgi:hypothetical protein
MRFSRVLLPSVLALIPIIVSAAPQTGEKTTVDVVQVPVSVTTHGSSVRGLTREDFTLRAVCLRRPEGGRVRASGHRRPRQLEH